MRQGNINAGEIAEIRRSSVLAGYKIVPAEGKNPNITGWQNINAGPDDVFRWETAYPRHTNTGVLTARTPAVDIDIEIKKAADAVEALLRDRFGSRGPFLLRYGMHPKRAIPFRAAVPFKKMVATLVAPDGTKQRVEVLGDGQHFVVHGIHPDTGEPYSWADGELWKTPHEHLPSITQQEALDFINEAAGLLVAQHSYKLEAITNANDEGKPNGNPNGHANGDTFFKRINGAALANIGAWITDLFPTAQRQKGTGAWRVSSRDLGRDLEEDLSVSPKGIKDWGVADMGDPREGRRTPIDLVIGRGRATDAIEAARYLCGRLGVSMESLGWQESPSISPGRETEPDIEPANLSGGTMPAATALKWLDLSFGVQF